MKIKYLCRFCGMPALFHPPTQEVTPAIPDLLFEIGMAFHGFIISMCSLFFANYEPSFPIVFEQETKRFKRFKKYYL